MLHTISPTSLPHFLQYKNAVMRLLIRRADKATEVVLLRKLGENEV